MYFNIIHEWVLEIVALEHNSRGLKYTAKHEILFPGFKEKQNWFWKVRVLVHRKLVKTPWVSIVNLISTETDCKSVIKDEVQLAKGEKLVFEPQPEFHPWTFTKARFSIMKLTSPGEKKHRLLQQDLT